MLDKRVSHVSMQVSVLYVCNYIMHKQIISENITSKDYINQGTKVTTQFLFYITSDVKNIRKYDQKIKMSSASGYPYYILQLP